MEIICEPKVFIKQVDLNNLSDKIPRNLNISPIPHCFTFWFKPSLQTDVYCATELLRTDPFLTAAGPLKPALPTSSFLIPSPPYFHIYYFSNIILIIAVFILI